MSIKLSKIRVIKCFVVLKLQRINRMKREFTKMNIIIGIYILVISKKQQHKIIIKSEKLNIPIKLMVSADNFNTAEILV